MEEEEEEEGAGFLSGLRRKSGVSPYYVFPGSVVWELNRVCGCGGGAGIGVGL